ncbi:MAG: hypothetical protein EOO38_25450, partial [Cytophagaceae bacterium]
MKAKDLKDSIEAGLGFLEHSQLPSGEFKCFMSRDNSMETDCVVDSSPFPTALIAYCLSFAPGEGARAMLDSATQFFLAEMEGPGLWRYWTKQHQYHGVIPPDLDDIACVSYVLRQQGLTFPSNSAMVLHSRDAQGLFYTWITPRWRMPRHIPFWRVALRQLKNPIQHYGFWKLNESNADDVDGVVNANVLFYLGECPETQAVIKYLIEVVQQKKEDCCDKWHLNRFTFYYVVGRNFHQGIEAFEAVREVVIARIISYAKPNGSIGDNELETALAICALLYWKSSPPELKRAVQFLLDKQKDGGDWTRSVLY